MLRTHLPPVLRFLLLLSVPLFAGTSSLDASLDESAPSVPIDEWLSHGEQKQFQCGVHISRPTLTFQQRYRVFVKARIPARSLQRESVRRDLHFFVKVADQNGKWLSGQTYNHIRVEKQFDKRIELELDAGLYLQPGRFTIAVVVYDSVLHEHNIVFRHITVERPKRDAFPKLLEGLPRVEFLPSPLEGVAALASGHAFLPVETDRPVELDVVVDLSPYTHGPLVWAQSWPQSIPGADVPSARGGIYAERLPGAAPQSGSPIPLTGSFRRPLPEGVRRTVKGFQSRLLEAASILGDVDPKNGCTRVTVFNALSRRVLMKAQPSISADWLKTWDEVLGTELNLISVQDLAGSVEAATFLHDQIEKLMSQAAPCQVFRSKPVRVLAILSRGAHFPYGAIQPRIDAKCDCRIFYLLEHEDVTEVFDDFQRMLKPLSPKRMEFSDPKQFRHKLSELINRIQELGAD